MTMPQLGHQEPKQSDVKTSNSAAPQVKICKHNEFRMQSCVKQKVDTTIETDRWKCWHDLSSPTQQTDMMHNLHAHIYSS